MYQNLLVMGLFGIDSLFGIRISVPMPRSTFNLQPFSQNFNDLAHSTRNFGVLSMSREKSSEGPYRTNGSMIGRNTSKGGSEKLDTRSAKQTVEQGHSLHGDDKTRRTLKVCKYPGCFFNSFGLIQFLEVQNRHIQLIGIGGK